MYLLDTNHCSALLDGHPVVVERLRQLDPAVVAISVIVQGELRFMAYHFERIERNRAAAEAFLGTVRIYSIDDQTTDRYARIKASIFRHFGPRETAKRRRTTIGRLGFDENDIWIAATPQCFGLVVVSSDGDFARIAEATPLTHESWLPSGPA